MTVDERCPGVGNPVAFAWKLVSVDTRLDYVVIESPRTGNRAQVARCWVKAVDA